MRAKVLRYGRFILLSWLIYNSYMFFVFPFLYPWSTLYKIFLQRLLFQPFYNIYVLVKQSYYLLHYTWEVWVMIFIFYILAAIPLYIWWRKQTVARAWVLAFSGMALGPGLVYLLPARFNFVVFDALKGFLCLNLFYLLLVIANGCQKRFWPDSKFASRLRTLLSRCCLRT